MGLKQPPAMGGCELYDPLGRKIGRVEELFAGEDDRPKRVRVKVGASNMLRAEYVPQVAL